MVDTATQVPNQLVAGDTLAWERDLSSDYPASTWTLTYYFESPTDQFSVTATADGDTHAVSVAGATTGAYKAGDYRWHARVTDGSTITTVDQGWLKILPNPASSANTDWRSHARKMVEAIEAALEGQATQGQLDLISYSVGGTFSVTRDREHLIKLRDRYRWELMNEDATSGLSNPRHVYVRFGRA